METTKTTQAALQTKTKDSMSKVTEYFENQKEQKKGLLLYGPNGTGKTTAIEKYAKGKWYGSSIQFCGKVQQSGRGYLQKYTMHDMIIDDLGREDLTVKSFGDEINVMHDLIFIRYEAFKNGYKTHFTTNLSFKEIQERYGVAIADRLKEMTSPVEFLGESFRK